MFYKATFIEQFSVEEIVWKYRKTKWGVHLRFSIDC